MENILVFSGSCFCILSLLFCSGIFFLCFFCFLHGVSFNHSTASLYIASVMCQLSCLLRGLLKVFFIYTFSSLARSIPNSVPVLYPLNTIKNTRGFVQFELSVKIRTSEAMLRSLLE